MAILAGPGCALYVMTVRRSIKRLRTGDAEWRRRWRQLDPQRRRTIRHRMRRGQPASDPEDADLLVRAVGQVDHVVRAMAPMTTSSLLIIAAMLVGGIVSGAAFLILAGAIGFVSWGVLDLLSRRQRSMYHRSASSTQRRHPGKTS